MRADRLEIQSKSIYVLVSRLRKWESFLSKESIYTHEKLIFFVHFRLRAR